MLRMYYWGGVLLVCLEDAWVALYLVCALKDGETLGSPPTAPEISDTVQEYAPRTVVKVHINGQNVKCAGTSTNFTRFRPPATRWTVPPTTRASKLGRTRP